MKKQIKSLSIDWDDSIGFLAIAFLGYAFYNPAIRLVPVDYDDLILLSAVKNTGNPLSFFINDWGFGNYGYRPLHSISLWIGYRLFGVSAGPNQLLNIILHVAVALLLYYLLIKLSSSKLIAFLATCLALISFYTFSPPTWISDRPTLLVAFFLMVLLNYLFQASERLPKIWILAGLSIFGLLSKESGLILPLTTIIFIFLYAKPSPKRKTILLSMASIILVYIALRFAIFGTQAGTYEESGYLFGTRYYSSSAELTIIENLISKAENFIKNILAIFIPIFDGQGKISFLGKITNSVILVPGTVLLTFLAINRKLNKAQIIGLALIGLNALIHYQVFRYRALYIGQVGFAILIASSNLLSQENKSRLLIAASIASIIFFWNMQMIGENITFEYLRRIDFLRSETFQSDILASSSSIDPEIINQVITKYRH